MRRDTRHSRADILVLKILRLPVRIYRGAMGEQTEKPPGEVPVPSSAACRRGQTLYIGFS